MTRAPLAMRALAVSGLLLFFAGATRSQQFNSDNYLSKPAGVATIILTYGQRNSMVMTTFSLVPNWEFTGRGVHSSTTTTTRSRARDTPPRTTSSGCCTRTRRRRVGSQ